MKSRSSENVGEKKHVVILITRFFVIPIVLTSVENRYFSLMHSNLRMKCSLTVLFGFFFRLKCSTSVDCKTTHFALFFFFFILRLFLSLWIAFDDWSMDNLCVFSNWREFYLMIFLLVLRCFDQRHVTDGQRQWFAHRVFSTDRQEEEEKKMQQSVEMCL